MHDVTGRVAIPGAHRRDVSAPDASRNGPVPRLAAKDRSGSAARNDADAPPPRKAAALHPTYPLLDNYARSPEGVIYQVTYDKFVYDETYIGRAYAAAPREAMSNLRFGYVVGSIGHVPKSLLDVGYGGGDFLRVAQRAVPEIYGYDIAPIYPLHDIPVLDSMFDRPVEVVTFFDSLEHFEDIAVVRDLRAKFVCISLPWCHYPSNDWFENWKHRKPNEHLWHFNHQSLTLFMKKMGFELLNFCNIEDGIRKPDDGLSNILSAVFAKV